MLQEIVTNESLVWDKFSVDDTKFLVNLSYESINELKKKRDFLTKTTIAVPRFQSEILNFKNRFLFFNNRVRALFFLALLALLLT